MPTSPFRYEETALEGEYGLSAGIDLSVPFATMVHDPPGKDGQEP